MLLIISAVFPVIGIDNNTKIVMKNQTSVKSEQQHDVISRDDEWPKFHHDPQNTGYSTSIAPQTNTVLWTFIAGFAIVSSPAVVNGKVYIGSDDEVFYCLDADNGSKLWDYPIPGGTSGSSPAVYDEKVYVGTTSYNIFCWDAETGDLIWNYPKDFGGSSSPAVVDGKVYIGAGGKIYCLNADNGSKLWNFTTGSSGFSSPAVADGKVYIGEFSGMVHCLNADNGSNLWDFDAGWHPISSPAVVNGKVYIGGSGLYCLDADTGKEFWCFNGRTACSPAVAYESIYFVSEDGKVYCLDAESGDEIWNYTTSEEENSFSSPAVADGRVYVGIWSSGMLLCLDAETGDKIWDYPISPGNPGHQFSSPAVAYGRVYIGGTMTNKVYCFEDPSKPPKRPSIRGPTSGKAGEEYEYKFLTTDPEENDVYYWIEWFEDDPNAKWEGPYASGEEIIRNHTWYDKRNYTIRVKAKDTYNIESHWASLTVTIPRNKATINSFFYNLLERFPLLKQLFSLYFS